MFRKIEALFHKSIGRPGAKAVFSLAILIIVLGASPLFCADQIVLVQTGNKDAALWTGFKKYLAGKGYAVSIHEAADTMEKQVETANRINKEKGRFMLVMEMLPSPGGTDVFVAVSNAKKGRGRILEIEEITGSHIAQSEELAALIASRFQKKVKAIPLFALLGIDMPGVFLRLSVQKDRALEAFDMLHDGMANYLKRGIKDERERKSVRRNPPP